MIRPAQDICNGSIVLDFYKKINNCTTLPQALRALHTFVNRQIPLKKLSLFIFDSENQFIRDSLEISGTSSRVNKDVRTYLIPKDIDLIYGSREIDLFEVDLLHASDRHHGTADYAIPLTSMNECKGFLLISLPVDHGDLIDSVMRNSLLQMAGYLACFVMNLDTSAQLEEKNAVLAETKDYVSSILENMVHGVISINNQGEVTTFSRGAEILLEINGADVVGYNYRNVFPSQISTLIDDIKENLRNTQYVVESEAEYIMQGKFFIPIKFSASMLKDKQGNEAGLLLICKDSSTVKRIIALQELRNMRSEFLSTASHEFKTPLNLIMGSSGILANGMVGSMTCQQEHLVKLIQEGSKRLHTLINDLLDMSKSENAEAIHLSEVNLPAVLHDCLTIHEQTAVEKSIDIGVTVDDSDLSITATNDSVTKIFDNLLSNAIKYTPEGGKVQVRIDLVQTTTSSDIFYDFSNNHRLSDSQTAARIVVSDTGIGIAAEDHEQIFDDFKRGNTPYVKKVEGTGLGLSITKRLVRSLGGSISVDSQIDKGSTFTVYLPLTSPKESNRALG